jgi:drug/metabolite transporter (DMT)-like permease
MKSQGPILAFVSAALFALSPVLTKAVLGDVPPLVAAGLLYLGSGFGLALWAAVRGDFRSWKRPPLSRRDLWALSGAVIAGGILAPTLLVLGIKYSAAFEVSLLLNLETVATTVLAVFLFHEHVGVRVWIGQSFIVAGAALVSLQGPSGALFSPSALFVLGACLLWGLDNNLTRGVENIGPSAIATMKGITAGLFNTALAFALGYAFPSIPVGGALLGIGFLSYGLSLVLFIQALRLLGSSRTGAYFAGGPFIGMLFAVALLNERPALHQWGGGILLGAGLWFLLREGHGHVHRHDPVAHAHPHVHDEHHRHGHGGIEIAEPHEHTHEHEPLAHSHAHVPDTHHRHRH